MSTSDLAAPGLRDRARPPPGARRDRRTRGTRPLSRCDLPRSAAPGWCVFMSDFAGRCQVDRRRMSDIELRHGPRSLTPPARFCSPPAATSASSSRRSGLTRTRLSPTSRTRSPRPQKTRRARSSGAFCREPARAGPLRLVRVNAVGTAFHADDLAAVGALGADGIVLPKATPGRRRRSGRRWTSRRRHRRDGRRACGSPTRPRRRPRVVALQIGAVDLGAELGLEPRPDGLELLYVRSKARARLGRGRAPRALRRRPPRRRAPDAGARGRVPARALARLSRQGVHPPVAGRRS